MNKRTHRAGETPESRDEEVIFGCDEFSSPRRYFSFPPDCLDTSGNRRELYFGEHYVDYLQKRPDLIGWLKRWLTDPDAILTDCEYLLLWKYLFPVTLTGPSDKPWEDYSGASYRKYCPVFRTKKEAQGFLEAILKASSVTPNLKVLKIDHREYIVYCRNIYFLLIEDQPDRWHSFLAAHKKYYQDFIPDTLPFCDNPVFEKAFIKAVLKNNPMLRLSYTKGVLEGKTGGIGQRSIIGRKTIFYLRDLIDRFKRELWFTMGEPELKLWNLSDKDFVRAFRTEWDRLIIHYSDDWKGLHISWYPLIKYLKRYIKLRGKHLRQEQCLWEMIDYVIYRICLQLRITIHVLDSELMKEWGHFLDLLTEPMRKEVSRLSFRGRNSVGKREKKKLEEAMKMRIIQLATLKYNFTYGKKKLIETSREAFFIAPLGIPFGRLGVYPSEYRKLKRRERVFAYLRPSVYIWTSLYKEYVGKKLAKKFVGIEKLPRIMENGEDNDEDEERLIEKIMDPKSKIDKAKVKNSPDYELVPRGTEIDGKYFLREKEVASHLGVSIYKVRKLEEEGVLDFKYISPGVTKRGRPCKELKFWRYNADKVDELRKICVTWKKIARKYSIHPKSLNRIRRRLNIINLPIKKQKKEILDYLEKRANRKKPDVNVQDSEMDSQAAMAIIEDEISKKVPEDIKRELKEALKAKDPEAFLNAIRKLRSR